MGEITEAAQESEIAGRFGLEHIDQRLLAVFHDGVEDLEGDDGHAGAVDDAGLDLSEFADQVSGEFRLGFGTLDGLTLFEIALVPGLEPVREALGSQATAAFRQLIENDVVRKRIVEHEIDHVASRLGETGDRWMMVDG